MKWCATALQIVGALMLAANVSWSGWAYPPLLVGSILWMWIGFAQKEHALGVLNATFTVINIVGIVRWLL